MTAKPLPTGAAIHIMGDQIMFSNWHINGHGREFNEEEIILACLTHLVELVHADIKNKALLTDHEVFELVPAHLKFEAERIACLAINTAAGKI